MLAANTPLSFWQALPEDAIANGYLNRWILFPAALRGTNDDVVFEGVPADITEHLTDIALVSRDVLARTNRPKARRLDWDNDGVHRAWKAMEAYLLPIFDGDTTLSHIVGRTAEHTIRLASKHAIGREGAGAKVRMDDLQWGASLAIASARAMLAGSEMMVSTEHAKLVRTIEALFRAKDEMSMSEVTRATRNATPREREDALKDLAAMGVIEAFDEATRGRTAKKWRRA